MNFFQTQPFLLNKMWLLIIYQEIQVELRGFNANQMADNIFIWARIVIGLKAVQDKTNLFKHYLKTFQSWIKFLRAKSISKPFTSIQNYEEMKFRLVAKIIIYFMFCSRTSQNIHIKITLMFYAYDASVLR
ncbi:unnamed protein product (macronuclear) [Paramecium tetraurelia]|uniref:Uncharacterized protein n=1 Tax=Paramecium tetraurelia TaxID=5888 RepID=A0BJ32_PARTE|nr:uncharacterized protein GSPATT00004922001 [Paramecium tetraurelia]CAK58549.1 unnamed protein product [Paramecium tetraurelia]|eukprot:XP_001425947.1 hypothetical protein (macronuclear) [Paramecium tetraurelia strain d4-2]